MRKVKVAATQMSCSWDKSETLMQADALALKQLQEAFPLDFYYGT